MKPLLGSKKVAEIDAQLLDSFYAEPNRARRAELCALRWKHLNLSLGAISVRRSVDRDGAETTEKDTKTHQHRRIALDPPRSRF